MLSPLLFSIYVNDFESYSANIYCTSIEIGLLNLYLLVYADNTVICL